MLHCFDLYLPSILEFDLYTLDWEQESEQLVVLLDGVRPEDQMQRPFDLVVKTEATPWILLV